MDFGVISTCLLIILARIGDVSIGTLRTICVVNGRATVSWALGFFEVLIWLFAVSQIFQNLGQPVYAVAYALGFATGNYVGVRVEQWLAFGEQAIRVFTRQGAELAGALRGDGWRVTEFEGHGRDGVVTLLMIKAKRRETKSVLRCVHEIDPHSFTVVDDVRSVRAPTARRLEATDWRTTLKKK